MSDEVHDYLQARQLWLERDGNTRVQLKNWRLAAILSLVASVLFAAGLVYEADRVHVVPYVVEVDKLGQTVELAQAIKAGAFAQPVVTHFISRFVWLVFTRSPDVHVQKTFVDDSYHFIDSKAQSVLDAFYSRHNPYSAYSNDTQGDTVTIQTAEPEGAITAKGGAYIVDFLVKHYGPHGNLNNEQNWQATISYATVPPSDNPNVLKGNPYGIYITHFAFSKQL
ncbi:type IV secretion system protein [Acidithiobacillus montserratensis]|uniref:Type IV secretion system protein n=1 Tax=Acidithiobacillus montserratensis TaxID=2729135 RepID=A0ACD5HL41_9PROT|nr:type IV secretion system protein [Acidithiobacillus montserratensis]MBU2749111.1 type IV secretion system protein [Acidithiobacillus montserratensis]